MAAAVVLFASCGGDTSALERRVASLEQRVAAGEQREQRLAALLRERGIAYEPAPSADDGDPLPRALRQLQAALDRLDSARDQQDVVQGQSAMQALEQALGELRRDAARSMPALLAAATGASAARQAALLDCVAKVGGAAATSPLLALANDAQAVATLRSAAVRALIAVDPAAAAGPTAQLLATSPVPPDGYLLVHLLAGTGHPSALPVLVEALARSPDRSVRCHAATGLGQFAGETAAAALAQAALGDEYPAVRTNALRALPKAATAERARAVAAKVAADDRDPAVRAVARELTPAASDR